MEKKESVVIYDVKKELIKLNDGNSTNEEFEKICNYVLEHKEEHTKKISDLRFVSPAYYNILRKDHPYFKIEK